MANVNELCSNWLENYFAERPQIEPPKQGIFGYEVPVWASAVIQKLLNDQMVWVDNFERLDAELEAIKKQEPAITLTPSAGGLYRADWHNDWKLMAGSQDFYYRPVYQHSFTVDGHTFYADNELDILYLERKFGVGGVPSLRAVDATEYECCGNPVMDNGYVCCGQYEPK